MNIIFKFGIAVVAYCTGVGLTFWLQCESHTIICTKESGFSVYGTMLPIVISIFLVGILVAVGCALMIKICERHAIFLAHRNWIVVFGILFGMIPVWVFERIVIPASKDDLPVKMYLPWAIGGGICALVLTSMRGKRNLKQEPQVPESN